MHSLSAAVGNVQSCQPTLWGLLSWMTREVSCGVICNRCLATCALHHLNPVYTRTVVQAPDCQPRRSA